MRHFFAKGVRRELTQRRRQRRGAAFANLAAAVAKLSARTLVLDGEVAIYDQQLRSRFDWLRELDPGAVASPPLFMAFDLLYHDRRDLTARPLRDRRARLGGRGREQRLGVPRAPGL